METHFACSDWMAITPQRLHGSRIPPSYFLQGVWVIFLGSDKVTFLFELPSHLTQLRVGWGSWRTFSWEALWNGILHLSMITRSAQANFLWQFLEISKGPAWKLLEELMVKQASCRTHTEKVEVRVCFVLLLTAHNGGCWEPSDVRLQFRERNNFPKLYTLAVTKFVLNEQLSFWCFIWCLSSGESSVNTPTWWTCSFSWFLKQLLTVLSGNLNVKLNFSQKVNLVQFGEMVLICSRWNEGFWTDNSSSARRPGREVRLESKTKFHLDLIRVYSSTTLGVSGSSFILGRVFELSHFTVELALTWLCASQNILSILEQIEYITGNPRQVFFPCLNQNQIPGIVWTSWCSYQSCLYQFRTVSRLAGYIRLWSCWYDPDVVWLVW